MTATKCVLLNDASPDQKLSSNTIHTNRFYRCTGKCKALSLTAQTSQARSVLLRPWALYFPIQHKTG